MSILNFIKNRNKRILENNNFPFKEVYYKIKEEISESIPEEVSQYYIESFRDGDGFIVIYYTCSEDLKDLVKGNFSTIESLYDAKSIYKNEEFFKEELLE